VDTSKLIVGERVLMISGCYALNGRVVKVTTFGVDVETIAVGGGPYIPGGVIYSFDVNGKGCDGRSTYECGPWEIEATTHECTNADHQHRTYESACNCKLK